MNEDYGQRRRVAVALAITVILGPAAFLLNRNGDDAASSSTSTLVGQVVIAGQQPTDDPDADSADDGPQATDPMGTTPPEIVLGTIPDQGNDPPTIAIPRPAPTVRGTASFSREITDPTACQVRDLVTIPWASEIVVTNLNNSQSVRCIVSVSGIAEHDVVLNADAFLQIGDLTDTPLSVELSW